jgi:hypothetical protein
VSELISQSKRQALPHDDNRPPEIAAPQQKQNFFDLRLLTTTIKKKAETDSHGTAFAHTPIMESLRPEYGCSNESGLSLKPTPRNREWYPQKEE